MRENDSDIVEEVFDTICFNPFEQSELFAGWWESLQLPITPCFGAINAMDLPQIFVLWPDPECWCAPILAHS